MWSITISFYRNGWLVHLIQEVFTYSYLSKTCDRQTSRKFCLCVIFIKIYIKSLLSKRINRYFIHAFNVKNVDKVIEISNYHNISAKIWTKSVNQEKTIIYQNNHGITYILSVRYHEIFMKSNILILIYLLCCIFRDINL